MLLNETPGLWPAPVRPLCQRGPCVREAPVAVLSRLFVRTARYRMHKKPCHQTADQCKITQRGPCGCDCWMAWVVSCSSACMQTRSTMRRNVAKHMCTCRTWDIRRRRVTYILPRLERHTPALRVLLCRVRMNMVDMVDLCHACVTKPYLQLDRIHAPTTTQHALERVCHLHCCC